MEIRAFLVLVVPFILVFYLAVLLFMRSARTVVLPSLLGGLVMGIINALFDLVAYNAHWWHYTLQGLTLHLPLPFYISPILIYGSFAYLLIWRFWRGRSRWFALLLLYGVPVFGILRDVLGEVTQTAYSSWDNTPLALLFTIVMWLVMFYAGFFLFWRLAPSYEQVMAREEQRVSVPVHSTDPS